MDQYKTLALFTFTVCVLLSCQPCVSQQSATGWAGKQEDIYVLIDCSRSMWIVDLQKMLRWLASLVNEMNIGAGATRVGVGVYSDTHQVVIPLNNTYTKQQLIYKLEHLECRDKNNTYISRAIQGMMEQGMPDGLARPGVPHVCILTTDGNAVYPTATREAADSAKEKNVYMLTIGVGKEVKSEEMRILASEPKADFAFYVPRFDDLNEAFKDRISHVLLNAESRQPNKTACGSSSRIDTVLVYDETALGTRTANKLVNLVTNFVNQLDMDSGNMRLSVYPHSCQGQATGNIALNRYIKSSTLKEGLNELRAEEEVMYAVMKDVRQNAFNIANGGRSYAERRIVLVVNEPLKPGSKLHRQCYFARREDIQVFIIYIGTDVKEDVVWDHSYTPDAPSHSLVINSAEQLDSQLATKLLEKFCKGI